MENENIDVPQEQQIQGGDDKLKQAHTSLLKLGYEVPEKFDEFKKAASDPKYLENVHKSLIKNDYDVPTNFSTFQTDMGFGEKKNSTPNSKPTPNNLQGGVQTQQPTSTSSQLGVNNGNAQLPTDPITALRGYKSELDRPTKQLPESRGETVVYSDDPADIEVKKKAGLDYQKALDNLSTQLGVKKEYAEKVINDFGHIANPQDIKERAELLQSNPIRYERQASSEQYQHILYPTIRNVINDQNIPIEQRQKVDEAFKNLRTLKQTMANSGDASYGNERYYTQSANKLIDEYVTDDEKRIKAKQGVAKEMSDAYGTINIPQVENDPRKQQFGLNNYQIAALNYLEDTDPNKFKGFSQVFIDPKEIEGNHDAQLGMEAKRKRLEQLGMGLASQNAQENGDKFNILPQIQADKSTLQEKYPSASYYENDKLAQDLSGKQSLTGKDWFMFKLGNSIMNTLGGAKDLVIDPFRSEKGQKIRDLEVYGDNIVSDVASHLIDKNTVLKNSEIIVDDPLITKQINDIKNDKSLSDKEKELSVIDLVKKNKDHISVKPIEGGETNLNVKSGLYALGGMTAELLPFIGLETLTGGGATAGVGRKFASLFASTAATSYQDLVANAVAEDVKNPREWALRNILVNSLALTAAGGITPKLIRAKATQSEFLNNIVNKMSDADIESMLRNPPSKLTNFLNIAKKTASDSFGLETLKATGAMTAGGVANQLFDGKDIDPVQQVKQFLVEFGKFGALGVATHLAGNIDKIPVENREALYQSARNKEQIIPFIDEQVARGDMTEKNANEIKGNIEKMSKVLENTPAIDAKGNPLTDEQSRDLMWIKMQQTDIEDMSKKDMPQEVKDKLADRWNKLKVQADKIYKGTYIAEPTETKKSTDETTATNGVPKKKGEETIEKPTIEVVEGVGKSNEPIASKEGSPATTEPIEATQSTKGTAEEIKSTEEALSKIDLKGKLPLSLDIDVSNPKEVAETYHDAKSKGIENDFTKKVEDLLGKPTAEVKVEEPNVSDVKEGSVGVGGDVKSNWNYEGEGDAFASNKDSRDGKSAYVIRVLDKNGRGNSYNRAKQRGELDTESPLTYEGDKESVSAIDGNGNTVGVIKLQTDGGVEHIVVAPEFSRKGVASELIKQIEQKGAKVQPEKSKQISPDAAKLFNKLQSLKETPKAETTSSKVAKPKVGDAAVNEKTQPTKQKVGEVNNIFTESDNPTREGKSKKALIDAKKEVFEKYQETYGENVKDKVKDINTNFDDYIKSLKEIGEIIKIEC